MATLFERLAQGRPPPTEMASKQPRRREDPKIFLKDILANGPVPATLVEERGAQHHGFTKIQIRYARAADEYYFIQRDRERRRPLVLGAAPRQSKYFGAAVNTWFLTVFEPVILLAG